jgi:hypothetical protein
LQIALACNYRANNNTKKFIHDFSQSVAKVCVVYYSPQQKNSFAIGSGDFETAFFFSLS